MSFPTFPFIPVPHHHPRFAHAGARAHRTPRSSSHLHVPLGLPFSPNPPPHLPPADAPHAAHAAHAAHVAHAPKAAHAACAAHAMPEAHVPHASKVAHAVRAVQPFVAAKFEPGLNEIAAPMQPMQPMQRTNLLKHIQPGPVKGTSGAEHPSLAAPVCKGVKRGTDALDPSPPALGDSPDAAHVPHAAHATVLGVREDAKGRKVQNLEPLPAALRSAPPPGPTSARSARLPALLSTLQPAHSGSLSSEPLPRAAKQSHQAAPQPALPSTLQLASSSLSPEPAPRPAKRGRPAGPAGLGRPAEQAKPVTSAGPAVPTDQNRASRTEPKARAHRTSTPTPAPSFPTLLPGVHSMPPGPTSYEGGDSAVGARGSAWDLFQGVLHGDEPTPDPGTKGGTSPEGQALSKGCRGRRRAGQGRHSREASLPASAAFSSQGGMEGSGGPRTRHKVAEQVSGCKFCEIP